MRTETRKSMEMLWSASGTCAKTASIVIDNKEMKITFNEYCHFHPHLGKGSVVESVDTPDLKSVDRWVVEFKVSLL